MEQQLFSELRTLYSLSWGKSNVIRLRIRLRDLVDSDSLRYAVETREKSAMETVMLGDRIRNREKEKVAIQYYLSEID